MKQNKNEMNDFAKKFVSCYVDEIKNVVDIFCLGLTKAIEECDYAETEQK